MTSRRSRRRTFILGMRRRSNSWMNRKRRAARSRGTKGDFRATLGMRISKKAEYALRALAAIARQPKCWQIQELSGRENIPIKFLEQILLALRHAGLLASKRGVGGGYT